MLSAMEGSVYGTRERRVKPRAGRMWRREKRLHPPPWPGVGGRGRGAGTAWLNAGENGAQTGAGEGGGAGGTRTGQELQPTNLICTVSSRVSGLTGLARII
jgi:hypothetical protein